MSEWPFGHLRMFGYDLLLIDPPWLVELRSAKGIGKSPQAHYDCMPLHEIKALPVGHLVGMNAWCFLWTSATLLDAGMDTLKGWGFEYCTRISWLKLTKNRKRRMGTGYVARSFHEDILIGKLGRPRYAGALPSLFDGLAREHSRKPDELFVHLECFAPNARRAELFARQSRPNWDTWGKERTKFDGIAAA